MCGSMFLSLLPWHVYHSWCNCVHFASKMIGVTAKMDLCRQAPSYIDMGITIDKPIVCKYQASNHLHWLQLSAVRLWPTNSPVQKLCFNGKPFHLGTLRIRSTHPCADFLPISGIPGEAADGFWVCGPPTLMIPFWNHSLKCAWRSQLLDSLLRDTGNISKTIYNSLICKTIFHKSTWVYSFL